MHGSQYVCPVIMKNETCTRIQIIEIKSCLSNRIRVKCAHSVVNYVPNVHASCNRAKEAIVNGCSNSLFLKQQIDSRGTFRVSNVVSICAGIRKQRFCKRRREEMSHVAFGDRFTANFYMVLHLCSICTLRVITNICRSPGASQCF